MAAIKDLDPAIVSASQDGGRAAAAAAAAAAPKKPLPPPIPVTGMVLATGAVGEDGTAPPKLIINHATHCAFSTGDGKFVGLPRATAGLVPGITVPAEPEAIGQTTDGSAVLVAVHHWQEKYAARGGVAAATAPTKFARPVTHTEMSQLASEWEKDFHDRLLMHEHETVFGVIKFCEAHKLESLLDFAIVSLSCALRGKSEDEMMLAMCQHGEKFTPEELDAAAAKHAWFSAITAPQ